MKTKYSGILLLLALVFLLTRLKMGKLKLPVIGAITSGFGYRTHPVTGAQGSFHNGIDIAVQVGTEVKAPAYGFVEQAYSNGSGGKQLILRHDNGLRSGYAHLSDNEVIPVGQRVREGEVIALTGNTGKSTGPHLHLTLKKSNGEYLDPEKYFV